MKIHVFLDGLVREIPADEFHRLRSEGAITAETLVNVDGRAIPAGQVGTTNFSTENIGVLPPPFLSCPQTVWPPRQPFEIPWKRPHSPVGIASFCVSLLSIGLGIGFIALLGYLETIHPGFFDEDTPYDVLFGLGLVALIGIDVTAFGLGLVDFFTEGYQKTFGILGFVFSGTLLLGMLCLVGIGLMLE